MAETEKDIQEIKNDVKKISDQINLQFETDFSNFFMKKKLEEVTVKIDNLDAKLSKHIHFVEKVYMPLEKSIDKFKKLFK